jgi:S-formylglutathione hydrolase FrmB
MGPASSPFIALMIAAAIGSVVITVGLWPRVASQRLGALAARLGLIVGSQLLVMAAILSFVNGYFSFFDSWSAVFGNGTPPPAAASGLAASSRPIMITGIDLGPVPGGGSALPELINGKPAIRPPHGYAGPHPSAEPTVVPGLEATGGVARAARSVGEVLQVTVSGEHTGIASPENYVYLPPQYFQKAYAHTQFPVVLALTGYPNDPWSIVKRLEVPATAARLVAAGKIGPAVYVMMNVSVALPRDTECTNVPGGPQAQTFLARDVPLAVERTFRVQSGRNGWAVIGYSTGGYCAAKLAMMEPDQFGAAVSMAGYYTAIKDSTTGNLYGGSRAYQNENSLDWRLTHLPAPPVSVLVTSSRVGEKDLPGTLAFLRLIHPPMRGYSLIVAQGGHNYRTWNRQLPQSLEWLSQRLVTALPSSGTPISVSPSASPSPASPTPASPSPSASSRRASSPAMPTPKTPSPRKPSPGG